MQEFFDGTVKGIKFEFERFFNQRNELVYIATFNAGKSGALHIYLKKDSEGDWRFLDAGLISLAGHMEFGLDQLIKVNEQSS